MTAALCLNCGEMKWGVLLPCPKCKTTAIGPMEIGIAFSDHHYISDTLSQLGIVIKEINIHCDEPMKCLLVFLHYISQIVPDSPSLDLEVEATHEIESILSKCKLPSVVFEESKMWGR